MEGKAKGNQAPAVKARNQAVKRLMEKHEDDYRFLLAEERTRAGLPANPEEHARLERIAKLEAQLAKLKAESTT